jgi:hypothetical protein
MFASRALHHLNHTSSAFCSSYFGDGGLGNCLSGLALFNKIPLLMIIPTQYRLVLKLTLTGAGNVACLACRGTQPKKVTNSFNEYCLK